MSTVAANPHQTMGKRLGAAFGWLVMAIIFGTTGWFFGIKPLATAVGNWNVARDYQAVDAKVVTRKGKASDGGEVTWPAATYEVGGKTFHAERLTVLDDDDPDVPANADVEKMLQASTGEGKTIKVWVSPRKPEIALVSRDLPIQSLWPRTPLAIGFGLVALAGVLGTLGALFSLGYYPRLFDAVGLWIFGGLWCGFIFPILLLVTSQGSIEWVAIIIVGLFALIGVLVLWGAVVASIKGTNPNAIQINVGSSRKSRLPDSALATTGGKKTAKVQGAVKRGGMGGRGDDFDKN